MKYTKDHEWIAMDGDIATIGITDYAREALGDLVFLELPEIGRALNAGDEFAVIESVKAASEIYSPLAGEVTEVHAALADKLDNITEDTDKGWMIRLKVSDKAPLEELMDKAVYDEFLKGL